MAYIVVDKDDATIKVTFGDYVDPNSNVYSEKGYKRIDSLSPIYKRENIRNLWKDKDHDDIVWLKMNDSISADLWPLTWDITNTSAVEGRAYAVSEIDGVSVFNDRDAFLSALRLLMK